MFMIFNNHAVNLDLVTRMFEETPGTVRFHFNGSTVLAEGVTIDQILTAQAAGQSRVQVSAVEPTPVEPTPNQTGFGGVGRSSLAQGHSVHTEPPPQRQRHFDDGSKRGKACGNDPQALQSIGRQS